ncbi:hypothetical protein YC2023_094934 [Brassica napus]
MKKVGGPELAATKYFELDPKDGGNYVVDCWRLPQRCHGRSQTVKAATPLRKAMEYETLSTMLLTEKPFKAPSTFWFLCDDTASASVLTPLFGIGSTIFFPVVSNGIQARRLSPQSSFSTIAIDIVFYQNRHTHRRGRHQFAMSTTISSFTTGQAVWGLCSTVGRWLRDYRYETDKCGKENDFDSRMIYGFRDQNVSLMFLGSLRDRLGLRVDAILLLPSELVVFAALSQMPFSFRLAHKLSSFSISKTYPFPFLFLPRFCSLFFHYLS